MRDLWDKLIDLYGTRKLTKDSDRLPALSGLAKRFRSWFKDEYVAGLWRRTLIGDLLWDSGRNPSIGWPPPEYRGPSWSWVAVNDIRSPMKRYQLCPKLATLVHCHVQVKGKNPYGEVSDGWIALRAPILPISVAEKPEKEKREAFHRFRTTNGDPKGSATYLDYKMDETVLRELSLFVVIVGRDAANNAEILFPGLVVTPAEGSDRYSRLGYILMNEKFLGGCTPDMGTTGYPTITLV